MSGSISFQRGPLRGWYLNYSDRWQGGGRVSVTASIEAPNTGGGVWGGAMFKPGVEGWTVAERAVWPGGVDQLIALAALLIETLARLARTRDDINPAVLARWRALTDLADQARADFHARHPDGIELPFQVVARLVVDTRPAGARP